MFAWITAYRLAAEARQLNKDAPAIISHAVELFQPKIVSEIAKTVREHVDRAHSQYGTSQIDLKRAHFDYKRLHKEARRRNDQTVLSAMTLTIIYLRAEICGEGAKSALRAIEAFVDAHDAG